MGDKQVERMEKEREGGSGGVGRGSSGTKIQVSSSCLKKSNKNM